MLRDGVMTSAAIDIEKIAIQRSGIRKERRSLPNSLGIGQIISWGTLYYSYPLIAEAMSQELSLSKSQIYGAATVGILASACFAYPIGKAIDKGHGRSIMVGGSLFAGILMLVWSVSSGIQLFYPIVLFLGIAQSMTLYEAAFAILARTTSQNQISHSITKLTLWGGFASTVFVPVAALLIQELGWRNALVVLGMFNFAVAALYYRTIPKTEKLEIRTEQTDFSSDDSGSSKSINHILKSRIFWALLVSFTLYSLVFSGLSFHIYPLFAELELSPLRVAAGMGLLGPAQVLGRLLIWKFSRRKSIALSGRYVMLAFPAAVLAILLLSPLSALLTFVITYGIANGIMTIIRGTAIPEMLTAQSYGSINSLISVPSTICKALGPFALALVYQRFGSYDWSIIGIFFVTVLILVSYLYATLKMPERS